MKFHKNKSEFVAYFCFCLTVQRSTDHVVHTECQRNRLLYYYVCSNTCIYLFKYKLIIIQKSFLTPCTDTTVMYSDNLQVLLTVTAVLFLKFFKKILYILPPQRHQAAPLYNSLSSPLNTIPTSPSLCSWPDGKNPVPFLTFHLYSRIFVFKL